ncbi:uncharacterized protein [Prorops nasuta]|uniref:uncharacterized protein n=1 Tax=Prorops nasuta TaxID=863751 RepID=UPI0034CE53C1
MNFADDKYYKLNRILMTTVGQWPYQNKAHSRILQVFCIFILWSDLLHAIMAFTLDTKSKFEMLQMLPEVIIILNSSCCVPILFGKSKYFLELMERLKKDWESSHVDEERKIKHKHAKLGMNITFYFTLYICVVIPIYLIINTKSIILDIIVPMNQSLEKKNLFPAKFLFDVSNHYYLRIRFIKGTENNAIAVSYALRELLTYQQFQKELLIMTMVRKMEEAIQLSQVKVMSQTNDDSLFDERYYKMCKKLTWFIGLWPYQPLLTKIPYYITSFFFVLSLTTVQTTSEWQETKFHFKLWAVHHYRVDINSAAEILPTLFASFIVVTKICGFTFNQRKVKILLERIKKNWKNFSSEKEIEVIEQYAGFGEKLTMIYVVYVWISVSLYLLPPYVILLCQNFVSPNVSLPEPKLPAYVYYGREVEEIFIFALIHITVSGMLFALAFAALDTFFIILIQHACSMFAVLGILLEQIATKETLDYDLHPKKEKDLNYFAVMRCIIIHRDILQFVNILESVFTVSLFFEIGLHIMMISITGLQALMHSTITSGAVQFMSLAFAELLHLLWICWQAQAILNSSAQVNKSICKGNWYKMSERSKKLLKIMLIRGSIPCRLTAGKVFTVSLKGFTVVLRKTISYFTVLKSLQYKVFYVKKKVTSVGARRFASKNILMLFVNVKQAICKNVQLAKVPSEKAKCRELLMENYQQKILRINKKFMWIIGVWPHMNLWEKFLALSFMTPIWFIQVVMQGGGMYSAWTVGSDIDAVLEMFAPFMISWMCLVKLSNFMINANKMKELLLIMEEDWRIHVKCKEEIEILSRYYRVGRKLTIGYAVCVYGSMVPFMAVPAVGAVSDLLDLNNGTQLKLLIFRVEYFVDIENYYYPVLIHSYFGTLGFITIVVAIDSMYVVYAQHICGVIAILGYRLEGYVEDENLNINFYPNKIDDKSLSNIKNCVIMHKRIIAYVTLLDDANAVSFLLQLGLNMICISFTAFQAAMKLENLDESLRFASFTVAQLFHLFCECWPAQQISDHSMRILDYTTSGKWYLTSVNSRRTLQIIMMRCLTPLKLTAGKFFVMNLQNFTAVVRMSFSYFTVLCSVNIEAI